MPMERLTATVVASQPVAVAVELALAADVLVVLMMYVWAFLKLFCRLTG